MIKNKLLITNIYSRKVLNSQFQLTNEFVVQIAHRFYGVGTAPQGETLSIYENAVKNTEISKILTKIFKTIITKRVDNQKEFDNFIMSFESKIGKNNCLALSIAFLNATSLSLKIHPYILLEKLYNLPGKLKNKPPTILINVLNGGRHAYTNPVLSDFHEFLLVPQFKDFKMLIDSFHRINGLIKKNLNKAQRTIVYGNSVHYFKLKDNRVWIEFLLKILQELNLLKNFKLMIDSSASDLISQSKYRLSLTTNEVKSPEKMVDYWINLLNTYPIQILEDPFSEKNIDAWSELNRKFPDRLIAGDNIFATNPKRIKNGGEHKLASATLIKPNQNGSISGTIKAIGEALNFHMIPIISHRSIETESTIISDLILAFNMPIVKMGLFSDFETIIKLNRLLRFYDNKKNRRSFSA